MDIDYNPNFKGNLTPEDKELFMNMSLFIFIFVLTLSFIMRKRLLSNEKSPLLNTIISIGQRNSCKTSFINYIIHRRLIKLEDDNRNDIHTINRVKVFDSKVYYDLMDIPLESNFKSHIINILPFTKIVFFFVTQDDIITVIEDYLYEILSNNNINSDTLLIIAFEESQKVFDKTIINQKEIKSLTNVLDNKLTLKQKEHYNKIGFLECSNNKYFKTLGDHLKNLLI